VEKILPASAATFALAPRDISAGEFTKVSQRIPVRFRILFVTPRFSVRQAVSFLSS